MNNTDLEMMIVSILCLVVVYLLWYFSNPFKPYESAFVREIDVTGKRVSETDKVVENYLIENRNRGISRAIEKHYEGFEKWEEENKAKLQKYKHFQKYRKKQYDESYRRSKANANSYIFVLVRKQTRYKQRNYVKEPYTVRQEVCRKRYTHDGISGKYNQLEAIGFEANLSDYHSKNQRKLMTKEMRRKVMERDNYTCQCCGKYMPDEVGLQIDHVVPVSKGGKTVLSNLQVLCSKCNGSKSNKM